MKRIYILVFVFTAALTMSGCAAKNGTDQKNNNSPANGQGEQNASGTPRMNFGTPASLADLAAGKKITVMGTTNTDGTVSATTIIIGEMPAFGPGFRSSTERFASGTMPVTSSSPQNFQPSVSGSGQFQGRTGGQWNGQNGTARQRTNRMSGQTRVSGEILKIDESSIVLKSADGGSKIVFYSDKTGIFNVPTSTPPFFREGASSTTPLPPPQP